MPISLVKGPVTRPVETAAERTYAAMPAPKPLVAVGDCGRDGGECGFA
ncbi:MAG: hypothetical protein ACREWG_13285 [Gammaproteobacteria bacterium]